MTSLQMPVWKRAVLLAVALLVLAGVYDALRNLPVVSGCAFYANCPMPTGDPLSGRPAAPEPD